MAEKGIMAMFKVMIIVMLFYSVSITLITYGLQDTSAVAQQQILPFTQTGEDIDLEGVSTQVEDSLTQQTDIPVIEVGALVFYSGNILIDLLLNFVHALPQMLGLIIHGITYLFNLDTYIWATIQIFATVLLYVSYFLGLIQLLTGIRSGRII